MNYKLFSFDKIPSTQTYAHELIARGDAADRTIILAAAQSAGRGRYRRKWVSHHGNLYASFIYKAAERRPTLSYAVAVAVAETLISFGMYPQIKWPNDILMDGKKMAGILIEYSKNFVIVGIGINIKSNPSVAGYETTKTDSFRIGITRDAMLAELMESMDNWIGKIVRGDFDSVRNRWTELALVPNSEIKYQGRLVAFCGINNDGALVLRRGSEYILTFGDEISI
ncbi:MAG: biotin--[acetyl-CoA-carboxylase] ligase [Rickettsiales bacterium]|jgi:BirA family biotin operon repressor/biotin-[acetyl-CoA-carboxylase] ligase|nr:biotin--[acetyl-CoA-carboxylase] ligase [Rickettsiales bacterium]